MTGGQPFSLHGRSRSFRHAFRGLAQVIRTQHNAWIHAAAPLVALAKDAAAGAVLFAAVGAAVIGALAFVPRLLELAG